MIEYKEFEFDGSNTESIMNGLNEAGKGDWLLASAIRRVDSRKVVCIMSRRRMGRPPKEQSSLSSGKENNETA
jgi:hypothetical protein